jgi:hypothetical protein
MGPGVWFCSAVSRFCQSAPSSDMSSLPRGRKSSRMNPNSAFASNGWYGTVLSYAWARRFFRVSCMCHQHS